MANQQHPNSPPTTKTVAPGVELVLAKERVEYLAETYDLKPPQVLVVRNAICVGATDAELEFFLATCRRVQLDPFAKQIWFVKRRQKIEDHFGNESWVDVGQPQTSIDGYRTIAERTGEYEGQAPMLWCGPSGKWTDVWLEKDPPTAAKATVFRKGFREPLANVTLFDEFCPKLKSGAPTAMWRKMPAGQIAKCAEAGAFRRAFPRDLSGIVTDTEAEHVDVGMTAFSAPPLPAQQAPKQLDERKPQVSVPANVEQREPEPMPRDTTKQGDGTPAGAMVQSNGADRTAASGELKSTTVADVMRNGEQLYTTLVKSGDDLDREMAKLVRALLDSTSRDDERFQTVGAIISKAKLDEKAAKAEQRDPDVYLATVLTVVKPLLEVRWRELAPATRKGARS